MAFSAKEAFQKCYYALTRTLLEPRDVAVSIDPLGDDAAGTFSVALRRPDLPLADRMRVVVGRCCRIGDLIVTGCTSRA